jgi:hypothetical protein
MAVYDDQDTNISNEELRHITGINEEQEGAHEREAYSGAAQDILGREQAAARGKVGTQTQGLANPSPGIQRGGFGVPNAPKATIQRGGFGSTAKGLAADQLAKEEAAAGEEEPEEESEDDYRSRTSAGGRMNDKLNKGYTPDGQKTDDATRTSNLYHSKSAFKKRLAIAIAAAGGSLATGVLVFIALLPLKIEHLVKNLEGRATAAASQAMAQEADTLLSRFITQQVLPNLNKGACHSTIDAGCVSGARSTNPVGQLFNAWKDSRMEQKLATKYGLVFTKKGSTYYMNVDGHDYRIHGDQNIFDLEGTSTATRTEIRRAVRDKIKQGTLWDKVYNRFKVNAFMRQKYGIKQCFPDRACAKIEKITDALKDRKLAAQGIVFRNFMPQKYGIIMQCIVGGDCDTNLEPAGPDDNQRTSSFQKKLQTQMAQYAAQFGSDKLADLVKRANDISKNGLSKVIAREAIKAIVSKLGGDAAGAAAGEAAEKAVPVVGWIFFGATVVATASSLGPFLQQADYSANSASAVQVAETYSTVVSEMHTGKYMDAATMGSFVESLNSNLDGSSSDRADATQTPLYNQYFNGADAGLNTASIFASLLPMASADTLASTGSKYKCNNGKPVPAGQVVCAEEVLNRGSSVANGISNFTDSVPGLTTVAVPVHALGNVFSDTIGNIISKIPGISQISNFIGSKISSFIGSIVSDLLVSPFSEHMSGGRIFDMLAAGKDVSANENCQALLGCMKASDAAMAEVQRQYIADEQADFASQTFFARMFDTNSMYSLTSRLALAMPTSLSTAANAGLGSLLDAPFSSLTSGFTGLFGGGNRASAAPVLKDPFGVPQAYYPTSDIPDNPEQYWNDNCVNGPKAKYDSTTKKLDVSDWLNSQIEDPGGSGTAVATSTNPCLLIQSTVQSVGGTSDASLLPTDGAAGSSALNTGTSNGTLPTGTTIELAKQIASNPNISFQTKQDSEYFDTIAATGKAGPYSCGGPEISPRLLATILTLSQNYKIVLGVLVGGHECDSGFHPKGMAVDINGVNPIGGGTGTGNNIHQDDFNGQPIVRQFYQSAGQLLAANGGGGLGQQQCFPGGAPKVPGVVYFDDACTHIHMDVGNR